MKPLHREAIFFFFRSRCPILPLSEPGDSSHLPPLFLRLSRPPLLICVMSMSRRLQTSPPSPFPDKWSPRLIREPSRSRPRFFFSPPLFATGPCQSPLMFLQMEVDESFLPPSEFPEFPHFFLFDKLPLITRSSLPFSLLSTSGPRLK